MSSFAAAAISTAIAAAIAATIAAVITAAIAAIIAAALAAAFWWIVVCGNPDPSPPSLVTSFDDVVLPPWASALDNVDSR